MRAGLGTNSAPSAPSRAVVEALDVKVEMFCDAPLFESTICESAALEETHTAENSFEDSLPLKVQVGCTFCNRKMCLDVWWCQRFWTFTWLWFLFVSFTCTM